MNHLPLLSTKALDELADCAFALISGRSSWLPAPRVENEEDRRRALYRSRILKKASHAVLDKIVRLAQKTFGVKTVLIMMWCVHTPRPVVPAGRQS